MEQLVNKVRIEGATVYDVAEETFAGPASIFTLSKTPEETEVRINYTATNVFLMNLTLNYFWLLLESCFDYSFSHLFWNFH